MNKITPYTIIGAGGHARSIVDSLRSIGKSVKGIIDLDYKGDKEFIMGVPVKGGYRKLTQTFDAKLGFLVIAVGDNKKRELIFNELINKGYKIPTIIHSTALICSSTAIGDGCFIGAGTIINAMVRIGANTIINTGSIIEHECAIGSHVHIAPGVNIAGRVSVGDSCFVGVGATVIENLHLDKNVTVGAGSVVIKNVIKDKTVLGVPAKER